MSITWTGDNTFTLEDVEYLCDLYGVRRGDDPRFCLAKHPRIVDRYAALIEALTPRNIVEVGILDGASTALFADLAKPDRLVAVELDPVPPKLLAFMEGRDDIAAYGGVDQADTGELQRIIAKEITGPLDLVVDDASHLLGPSRATFGCLFPMLRPGGVYVLEDWATGLREGGPSSHGAGERPLVDLVHEIIVAKGSDPRRIGDITVQAGWVSIVRGD